MRTLLCLFCSTLLDFLTLEFKRGQVLSLAECRRCKRRYEGGFALITTLLVSVMIFILCMGFLSMTLAENFNSKRDISRARAFYAADAGIEHAKATLPLTVPVGGTFPNGVSYSATILDNLDGSYTITSTGAHQNWIRRIEARYSPVQTPVINAGIEIISPDGETEIELEDGAKIDGNNWDAPADPSGCVDIDNCGTPVVGSLPGVVATANELEVEVSAPSVITGTPPVVSNSGNSADPWNELVNQLAEIADRVVTNADTIGPMETRTWGTQADPEITVVKNLTELQGTINGAGFLIVESGGDLELDHGELNWVGMVIIRGTGEVEVELETDDDTSLRIFGSVMVLTEGSDVEIEMEIENAKSFVKYSGSGVANAFDSLPSVVIGYWREI